MASANKGTDWPSLALSDPALPQKLKNAKVLCVGAGGIGCELLKTLVVSGFECIQVVSASLVCNPASQLALHVFNVCTCSIVWEWVAAPVHEKHLSYMIGFQPDPSCLQIDLDTIETSNLNRQFLFRKHHVSQSKATTAASVIKYVFVPSSPHHKHLQQTAFMTAGATRQVRCSNQAA